MVTVAVDGCLLFASPGEGTNRTTRRVFDDGLVGSLSFKVCFYVCGLSPLWLALAFVLIDFMLRPASAWVLVDFMYVSVLLWVRSGQEVRKEEGGNLRVTLRGVFHATWDLIAIGEMSAALLPLRATCKRCGGKVTCLIHAPCIRVLTILQPPTTIKRMRYRVWPTCHERHANVINQ